MAKKISIVKFLEAKAAYDKVRNTYNGAIKGASFQSDPAAAKEKIDEKYAGELLSTAKNCLIAAAPIDEYLLRINGKAARHCITSAYEVLAVANDAINIMDANGLLLKERAGAVVRFTSGGSVAKSYKYSRQLTNLVITFNAKGKPQEIEAARIEGYEGSDKPIVCIKPSAHESWLKRTAQIFCIVH